VESLRSEIPAGVAAVVRRLMTKDRAKRFQTPGELAGQLAAWCEPRPAWLDSAAKSNEPAELVPQEESTEHSGIAAAKPAGQPDTPEVEPPPPVVVSPPSLFLLRHKWWQWTSIVELTLRYHRRSGIDPQPFRSLQRELAAACYVGKQTIDDSRRALFQKMAALIEPWLELKALVELDEEIHCGLLRYCIEAGQELDSWLRAHRAEVQDDTVVGDVPIGFKNRRDWQAFQKRMHKYLGTDQ
jgi:hypothetical protein